ncbi:MAG: TonB-dependent receptor [Gammaproteobacteria bacterium]|nr:TonB-dependent receptor [Gammaproteobacteria bacterium]
MRNIGTALLTLFFATGTCSLVAQTSDSTVTPNEANAGISRQENSGTEQDGLPASGDSTGENDDSTVVYEAAFFAPYNPINANDMLDRIPGVSVGGGGPGGNRGPGGGNGGRGLGTGGNLLINGQRIAGKGNSTSDQLNRIAARDVRRIEIIRNTSGDLNVRGASEVINIVLFEGLSSPSTSVELVNRLNHDNTFETGGSISHSRQIGNFQAMVNLEARPNYENRDNRESSFSPEGELLGTLFETDIRDKDEYTLSTNMSYNSDGHRMQLNTQYQDGDHPRPIQRNFIDFTESGPVASVQHDLTDNIQNSWEIGGDYEYNFDNGSRASVLFVVNDRNRDSVRERFESDPIGAPLNKNLFIESNQQTSEQIVQGNYNFSLNDAHSLRVGVERAITQLDSSLFLGSISGSEPPSSQTGGLPPLPDSSNFGTTVEETRYEGFVYHNWNLNERMSLESSLFLEDFKIAQTGVFMSSRDFDFVRPSVDYRFNLADNFQIRASVRRDIEQLSFAYFAATENEEDRDQDIDAGNPQLEPEESWRYEVGMEYRLPNDVGVFNARVFYQDIENYIGKIDATTDPESPISATGNIGPAERYGLILDASSRLTYFNLPDAILTANLALFDSEIVEPFLGNKQRIGGRGRASVSFRHDITSLALSYGLEYRSSIDGGEYDIDITTITRDDGRPSLDLFVSRVFFDDVTVRLESDNTLDGSRCRIRYRFDGTTIDGTLREIEDSCSSRYRRLTLSIQTTF